MVDGRWSMVDGQWSMVDGRWSMVNGQWSMVDGGTVGMGCTPFFRASTGSADFQPASRRGRAIRR